MMLVLSLWGLSSIPLDIIFFLRTKAVFIIAGAKIWKRKTAERLYSSLQVGFIFALLLSFPSWESGNQTNEWSNCLSQVCITQMEQVVRGAGAELMRR
jgi:hypothetical protein